MGRTWEGFAKGKATAHGGIPHRRGRKRVGRVADAAAIWREKDRDQALGFLQVLIPKGR